MSVNFAKIMPVLVFSVLFFTFSCQNDVSESQDFFQVYNYDGTPFISHPYLDASFEIVCLPSQTLNSGYYPWKLYGKIVDGKMDIKFPNVKLSLREGLQMDQIYIQVKNKSFLGFSLRKKSHTNSQEFDSIRIFYATDDLIPKEPNVNTDIDFIEQEIELKAGWNFIEQRQNPK